MTPADLVVVPSTPALLPAYAGLVDPLADVRAACREAVEWLVGRHPGRIVVLANGPRPDNAARGVPTSAGERIGRHLLAEAGFGGAVIADGAVSPGDGVLAVANGSATRSEKAPGFLDERSFGFDAVIGRCLREGDPGGLADLDAERGRDLWADDVPVWHGLAGLAPPENVAVDFDGDPFGVQYWVVRWSCGS